MKNYKIAVAGTGYVGLSLGVLLSQHHQVVAVDIVQAKVDMINNKKSPIQDDYIEKYLAEKDLNLTATLDAKVALTIKDMTALLAPAYSEWDNHIYKQYLERFSLQQEQTIGTLSKGMKMKYALALALSHNAELLIEPI